MSKNEEVENKEKEVTKEEDDIKKEKVDKVIFLGDYITDGEDANEIIDIVKNTADYAILGNRERYMLKYSPAKKDYNNYKTIAYTYNILSKESLKYIKSLNGFKIIKLNDVKFLLIHGDEQLNNSEDMIAMFDKIIEDYHFDICLFGHTHNYSYTEYRDKIFINPGSIGQPTDSPTYKYCILDLGNQVNVKLREFNVSDSFNDLKEKYETSEYYKENPIWSTLILAGIKDGKDYCSPFIHKLNAKIEAAEFIDAESFNKIWNETYEEYINNNQLF